MNSKAEPQFPAPPDFLSSRVKKSLDKGAPPCYNGDENGVDGKSIRIPRPKRERAWLERA